MKHFALVKKVATVSHAEINNCTLFMIYAFQVDKTPTESMEPNFVDGILCVSESDFASCVEKKDPMFVPLGDLLCEYSTTTGLFIIINEIFFPPFNVSVFQKMEIREYSVCTKALLILQNLCNIIKKCKLFSPGLLTGPVLLTMKIQIGCFILC